MRTSAALLVLPVVSVAPAKAVEYYKFDGRWGCYGTGPAPFNCPVRICLDADGQVYVVECCHHRVQKFNKHGGFITTWGTQRSGDTNLHYRNGIAHGAGNFVFVANTYNHRIVRYTNSGTFVTEWGSYGTGDGQFSYPSGTRRRPGDKTGRVTERCTTKVTVKPLPAHDGTDLTAGAKAGGLMVDRTTTGGGVVSCGISSFEREWR